MDILQIIVLAFLVEAVWETLKMVWQDGRVSINQLGALVVGLSVALGYQVDLLASVGLSVGFSYFGALLTGILISRGGNYIHELVDSLKGMSE